MQHEQYLQNQYQLDKKRIEVTADELDDLSEVVETPVKDYSQQRYDEEYGKSDNGTANSTEIDPKRIVTKDRNNRIINFALCKW